MPMFPKSKRFETYIGGEEFIQSGFNFIKELDIHEEGLLSEMGRLASRGLFNTMMVTKTSLVKEEVERKNYTYLIEEINVVQASIPFAASCDMPGILDPIKLDGRMLVDGGWAEIVPVGAAHQL